MKNEVLDISFDFAVKIVLFCKKLNRLSKDNFVISNQLLKSGTSIGANIEEANAAQSKKDFLSKMYIAFKESRETNYWLRIIVNGHLDHSKELVELIEMSNSLIRILSSITKTARENLEKR
ncbi:MAG: four helix bundle protein [Candidatus Tenebribacter burtonii]|jgi:four helix bundle protein|nr:four helix bundle protein [Candidatus Tenebribacter burtonii]